MNKIAALYQNYLKERTEENKDFCTGGDKMEALHEFLKNKLNEDDYFTAEEMLNDLISVTEQKGFEAGRKYISELAKELFTE